MKEASAAHGVTDYFQRVDKEYEIQQGKNFCDAAKEAGVQHFIWSSLLNVTERRLTITPSLKSAVLTPCFFLVTNGELPNVDHFDSKSIVEDYARSLAIPATFFLPGFYMSNLGGASPLFKPAPPDNAWTLALPAGPGTKLPLFHTADTGKFVKAIVLNRDKVLGKQVLGATVYMTAQEVVESFKKLFPEVGRTARFFEVPKELFWAVQTAQGVPEHVITELYENVKLMDTYGYYGGASLDEPHALLQDVLTPWEEYARQADGFKDAK